MKLEFWFVGRTTEKYLEDGINEYMKRLKHYLPVSTVIISSAKARTADEAKKKEAELLLKNISAKDFVILLDENGKQYSSVEYSSFIQNKMNTSVSKIIFIVGGAFGFDATIIKRANHILSISKFTFTHQMIRLLLVEQCYRAMTILKNESYHHQ